MKSCFTQSWSPSHDFFRLDCQIFTEGNLLSRHYETQDWCIAAVAVDLLKVSPFCKLHPGVQPLGSWSHLRLRSFYSIWSDSQLWEEYCFLKNSSIPEWLRPLYSRETVNPMFSLSSPYRLISEPVWTFFWPVSCKAVFTVCLYKSPPVNWMDSSRGVETSQR